MFKPGTRLRLGLGLGIPEVEVEVPQVLPRWERQQAVAALGAKA